MTREVAGTIDKLDTRWLAGFIDYSIATVRGQTRNSWYSSAQKRVVKDPLTRLVPVPRCATRLSGKARNVQTSL